MATLTDDDLAKVAALARLRLGPDEIHALRADLEGILGHVAQLQQLDVAGVEPLAHPLPLRNAFRDDAARPGQPADDALANAPKRAGDFYAVPAILD